MEGALPATPEEITPAFLASALGATPARVEVVEAHSGTTGRAGLRVSWQPGSTLPSRIFAKLAPSDPTSREMVSSTGMGRREARFYAELAGDVPVRTPASYWSRWSEDGASYLMLLEDLCESGCGFPDADDPRLLDRVSSLVDELASLHAAFLGSPRFAADLSWIEPPMNLEWGELLVRMGLEQLESSMPSDAVALARLYLASRDAFVEVLDRGTPTLVHGDAHLGNLFLDGERIGFLDWACLARGPLGRDVAYFLGASIPTELRRAEERNLIERYRQGLLAAGVAAPPFDSLFDDYRRLVASSWIAAISTVAAGARMQSLEVGRRAFERANATVRDLDTLAIYRRAL